VLEYEDIFVPPDGSPGFTDLVAHKIDTGDAKPIKNYYRRSMKERAYVDAELKKDADQLPRLGECLDALEGSRFFSTLDLASGYWQVAMDPKEIKGYIEKVPLLYYPLPDTEFHLKADASLFAIGGILEQEQHGRMVPLGFASKTLCTGRQACCATKRVLYAVVFFARYYRDITRGTMVVIWTDHAALTWVQAYHQSDNAFTRWIVELS
jgi:hypothetical protein